MIDRIDLLERLSTAVGVAGRETEVRQIVLDEITALGLSPSVDRLNNVTVEVPGASDEKLLIDAHLDEVGFMVATIDSEGFIRLGAVGSWDPRVLPAQTVTIRTADGEHVRGVIGTVPPHQLAAEDAKRVKQIHELFVDVGASSADEVANRGIRIGDGVVCVHPFERPAEDLVLGKAFDDRAGCTAALATLEGLMNSADQPPLTTVFSFATSEEVGLRGARVIGQAVQPAVALALECTTAVDLPGVAATHRSCRFGGGAAITLADRSVICDEAVIELLRSISAAQGIPMQEKVPIYAGGNDAAAIQLAGLGAKCGVVSVPCRYIHTSASMLRPSDLDAVIELTTAFAFQADKVLSG